MDFLSLSFCSKQVEISRARAGAVGGAASPGNGNFGVTPERAPQILPLLSQL